MIGSHVLEARYIYDNYLAQLPSQDFLNVNLSSGAVGPNVDWAATHSGFPNTRSQEIGELLVCRGLALADNRDLTSGLTVLQFGFGLQNSDGSFPAHQWEQRSHAATSFFLCAAANTLIMLDQAASSHYERVSADWLPKMARGAAFVAQNSPDHPELTNLFWATASAVSLVSSLVSTQNLYDAAVRLCDAAALTQTPAGWWPERGGPDTLYQAVGLIYGVFAFVASSNQPARERIRTALDKGFLWLADRVTDDGCIDCSQNTRKTLDKLLPDNESVYTGDFVNADYAFRMWSDLTGEAKWTALADRIRSWVQQHCPGVQGASWDEKLSRQD